MLYLLQEYLIALDEVSGMDNNVFSDNTQSLYYYSKNPRRYALFSAEYGRIPNEPSLRHTVWPLREEALKSISLLDGTRLTSPLELIIKINKCEF